jgi:hypothetical protein
MTQQPILEGYADPECRDHFVGGEIRGRRFYAGGLAKTDDFNSVQHIKVPFFPNQKKKSHEVTRDCL